LIHRIMTSIPSKVQWMLLHFVLISSAKLISIVNCRFWRKCSCRFTRRNFCRILAVPVLYSV
jgi:hypothetical protein